MLEAAFSDRIEICATFIETCGSMVPTRAANDEPRAMQRDRGPELSAALQDRRIDGADVPPTITAPLKKVHRPSGMHALDRLLRRTDGQEIAMNRDRTAEVSVRIECGVLDWRIACPTATTQPECMNDWWGETQIVIVP